MLQHIDTMIGFAVVMLLLSLLVTVLVQGVVAAINLRGVNLLWGLKALLPQFAPLTRTEAELLSKAVLLHRTVSPAWQGWPFGFMRYAGAIRSDEIVKVLASLVEEGTLKDVEGGPRLRSGAEQILENLAARETRVWASMLAHELDKLLPSEAERARLVLDRARDRAARGRDAFKEWYDTVMDRTSERFVSRTRFITVGFAALLAFGLAIDSLYIFKRYSGDAEVRVKLLQSAETTIKIVDDYRMRKEASGPAAAEELIRNRLEELGVAAEEIRRQLDERDVPLAPPEPYADYWRPRHVLGMLGTMLLLSLGAPFWYNLLRQLANLRPLIAGKVDKSEALEE